jgi:hypothetical protein
MRQNNDIRRVFEYYIARFMRRERGGNICRQQDPTCFNVLEKASRLLRRAIPRNCRIVIRIQPRIPRVEIYRCWADEDSS